MLSSNSFLFGLLFPFSLFLDFYLRLLFGLLCSFSFFEFLSVFFILLRSHFGFLQKILSVARLKKILNFIDIKDSQN